MSRSLHFLLAVFCSMQFQNGLSQNREYTSYTKDNGLPSNNVYRVLEGNKGFLWVVTDAGVARFDGKNFQVFTVKHGLSDNENFYIEKEKNGRIWVTGFKQSPAYFDEVKNRFVTPLDKKMQAWFENTALAVLIPLPGGGMMYTNNTRFLIFKDAKLTDYGERKGKWKGDEVKKFEDGALFWKWPKEYRNVPKFKLYSYQGPNTVDSITVAIGTSGFIKKLYINDSRLYIEISNSDKIIVLSDFERNPIRYNSTSIDLLEPFVDCFFTDKRVCFLAYSGKIYVYDKQTLKLVHILSGDYLPNSFGEDSKGNLYVTTVDRGLVVYRKNQIKKFDIPERFAHTSFLSIARRNDGVFFAGNHYGEIAEFKDGKFSVHKTNNIVTSKVRKIIFSGDDVYTFSELGIFRNYTQPIFHKRPGKISFAKRAMLYNDSLILVGTHYGVLELNTRTQKMRELVPGNKEISIRNTALVKAEYPFVYFGSINGLYKFNYKTEKHQFLSDALPELKTRISTLCHTKDGLLWVGTSDNRVIVLKNDKIILDIPDNSASNGSIRHITAGKQGHVWVSTSDGINIIQYKNNGEKLNYTVKKVSVNDGLGSNDVHELLYHKGAIYAATSNGISIIPENYVAPKTNIPTYLVRMSINQKDTIISDHYQLKHGQQDLQMQFAGVDLNGYFGHLQYQLGQGGTWIDLGQNTLAIRLGTGNHQLKVRAVDVSGNISNKILTLWFDVAVPFWQNIWFWIVFGALLQIVLFFAISRYQKRKRGAKLAQKIALVQTAAIEQQAFTSLMNPHFIFNALNSVQHYINVRDRKNANRYLSDFASLIRKSFDAAQQSFIPLEEEIENIKIYLNLERMRFDGRFKCKIHVDDSLEVEDWMVPTMVLQPLLENALLHGIMPSAIPGEISVQFKQHDQYLLIVIADNGIGMANSLTLKGHSIHKSRGMELIGKRIKALSHFGPKPISITMEPAFDSTTNPGNKVTLLIPEALYQSWRGNQQT